MKRKYKKTAKYRCACPSGKGWAKNAFSYVAHDEDHVVVRSDVTGKLRSVPHAAVEEMPLTAEQVFKRHVRSAAHKHHWQEVVNILERNGVEVILKRIEG